MCNFFSAVLTKDDAFWGESDSHEAIIRGENQKNQPLHADGSRGPNVLRTECRPSKRTKRLEDFDSYDFVIDQDTTPAWYDKANAEQRTREALRERFKGKKVERVGTLIIPQGAKIAAKYLTSVGGSLCVRADFQAPALTSVGGYLDVQADFQAPALTSVGDSLGVRADFQAPALTSVGGYLDVQADFQAPALTSVGGSLCVRADFQAPALTSVGGYLDVRADFQAPALTSVGGSLCVRADFQAPALTSVGGYLYVQAGGKLDAKKLAKVNGRPYKAVRNAK